MSEIVLRDSNCKTNTRNVYLNVWNKWMHWRDCLTSRSKPCFKSQSTISLHFSFRRFTARTSNQMALRFVRTMFDRKHDITQTDINIQRKQFDWLLPLMCIEDTLSCRLHTNPVHRAIKWVDYIDENNDTNDTDDTSLWHVLPPINRSDNLLIIVFSMSTRPNKWNRRQTSFFSDKYFVWPLALSASFRVFIGRESPQPRVSLLQSFDE